MDTEVYFRFIVTLLGVLGLIALIAWAVRRFGLAGRLIPGAGQGRRLGIVEVTALDTRRRLVLVRRDGVEHLLLLGQGPDLLIEQGIVPKARQGTETEEPRP